MSWASLSVWNGVEFISLSGASPVGSVAIFHLHPSLPWLYQSTLLMCLLTTKGFSISFPAAGTFTDTLLGKKMEKWEELSHSEFIFTEVNFQEGRLWTICWSLLIFVELCEHEGLWVLGVTVHRDRRWHVATLQKANVHLTSLLPVRSGCGLLGSTSFYKGKSVLKNFVEELWENEGSNFFSPHQRQCWC